MSGKSSHVYPVTYSILAKYDLYNSHLTGFPLASRIIFLCHQGKMSMFHRLAAGQHSFRY